ncbi:MAG TPA: beta-1,6-N-acetylglucosaminyltransferase [Flavisolibacter sp.]|nr:beta-1,6-N-acetylglucosaminyltransferase [Flavisolibacter sp.]
MRIAHLILAHKRPDQLQKLIEALMHPAFDFYIHIDKKIDITPFLYLRELSNVYFVEKRVKVYWASFGVVRATLNGIDEILEKDYDYINVISGQDFPLKSPDYIFNFLQQKKGTEFITCDSIHDTWQEAAPRVKKYFLANFRIRFKRPLEKLLNILPERKFPLDLDIVGRSCWFTITPKAAKYMIDFLNKHPEIERFFKYSWGADELIYSTILYNSPFKNKIEDNLMYVDFTGKNDGHPNVLTIAEYEILKSSNKLFARKFDLDIDEVILDKIKSKMKTESFN